MPKDSYDDPKKAEVRARWKKFIRRNLPGNSRDWTVVCMPWGNEEQSFEIEEVYKPLNIREGNIIAIERDKRHATILRRLYPHMELFEGEDVEFLEKFNQRAQIINLDYDGTFNSARRKALEFIAGRQLLCNPSAMGMHVSGRREENGAKFTYLSVLPVPEYNFFKSLGLEKQSDILYDSKIETIDDLKKIVGSLGYDEREARNVGITSAITAFLTFGKSALEFNPMAKKLPIFRELLKEAESRIKQMKIDMKPCQSMAFSNETLLYVFNALSELPFTGEFKAYMACMIINSLNEPYIPTQVERYKYTSRSGTPMFSDLFLLSQYPDALKRYRHLTYQILNNINIGYNTPEIYAAFGLDIMNVNGNITEDLIKNLSERVIRNFISDLNSFTPRNFKERVDLGSSYKPRLTGQEYYHLSVEDGKTDKEIKEMRRVTPAQLRAFKAHITMGTYGPVPEKVVAHNESTVEEAVDEIGTAEPSERYSLSSIIPRKYRRNHESLSENAKLRMQYFIDDLYGIEIGEDRIGELLSNIKDSKWYENGEKPTDTQVYSFFDDLFMCARNGYIPDSGTIMKVYKSVMKGDIDPEVSKYVTKQTIPEKRLTKSFVGKTMLEIIKQRGFAYATDISQNPEELPIVAMLMANWKSDSDNSKYGLVARRDKGGNLAYIVDPKKSSTKIYLDSRGVTHNSIESRDIAERGYREK